jgi:hypothetical protein
MDSLDILADVVQVVFGLFAIRIAIVGVIHVSPGRQDRLAIQRRTPPKLIATITLSAPTRVLVAVCRVCLVLLTAWDIMRQFHH